MHRNGKLLAAAVIALSTLSTQAVAREDLSIIGSRTVAPYAEIVAAQFVTQGFGKPEIAESNSTQGFKHFCRGVGSLYPDIAMASRPIKSAETEDCKAHGVEGITEIKIGYDGVVIAYRGDSGFGELSMTGRQMWLAMAKTVPVNGAMAPNPYKNWNEIDPSLPASPILLYLAAKGNAGRDLFGDLVLKPVCNDEPAMAAMAEDAREEACLAAREDGLVIDFEASRDALLAMTESSDQPLVLTNLQTVSTTPEAKDAPLIKIDGVAPNASTIASGEYKASRTHYLYVKNQNVGQVPGVMDFVAEFVSNEAQGPNGYLVKDGWIPLKDDERQEMLSRIKSASNS
jgi:phosphate transport system substrate-binding protein